MDKVLCLFIFVFFTTFLPAQINFKSATVEKVTTAGVSGFVYVDGTWCVSCQVMEETTFKANSIRSALAGKYNAYKIDIDSKEGKKWAEKFDICCLPTMLFFDEKGNQIQKIQAPLTSTALISILEKLNSYNSKPVLPKAHAFESEEFSEGTIIMEEISFSEAYPKAVSSVVSENSTTTLGAAQSFTKEIIEYSEQRNDATSEQKRGEFLYHLSNHIDSLEALYIKYAISDSDQVSDIISQVKTPATNQKLPISTTQKVENGQLIEDTETLYELIQELKDWEERLRNTDYKITRPMFVADSEEELELELPKEFVAAVADNAFYLQMGYFKNEKFAKRLAKDLKDNYDYSIELKLEKESRGTFHRVLLGNFKNEKEAKEVYKIMKKAGRNAFVKKG